MRKGRRKSETLEIENIERAARYARMAFGTYSESGVQLSAVPGKSDHPCNEKH